MPVVTTSTAVSEGKPPNCSEMPIATGVVTDLGTSDASVVLDAPSAQAKTRALAVVVSVPTTMPPNNGNQARRKRWLCSNNGTASATVAGPSKKCTNCAPSKYVE